MGTTGDVIRNKNHRPGVGVYVLMGCQLSRTCVLKRVLVDDIPIDCLNVPVMHTCKHVSIVAYVEQGVTKYKVYARGESMTDLEFSDADYGPDDLRAWIRGHKDFGPNDRINY